MDMLVTTVTVFLFAFGVSLLLTPLVRRLALRAGLADQPDRHRKLHLAPVPLGGGVAVYLAMVLTLATVVLTPNPLRRVFEERWGEIVAILIGGAILIVVGLVDDYKGLSGRRKLLGQVLAASVVMMTGPAIERISIFQWHVELGVLAIPFTLFWLLGAINALNLLDGIDGQAALLGIVLSATIAVMAVMTGHPALAIIAVAFAGGLLGFLRFNFPPASIYLGDAGSMLIGLIVGTLALRASLKGPGTAILASAVAICALPIFDSLAAILRRKLTGRSIYATDRGHLHHRLFQALGNNRRVLGVVGGCCAATSLSALLTVFLNNDLIAVIACLGIVGVLVATDLFGRGEAMLVANRLRDLAMRPWAKTVHPRQSAVRLQGHRRWEGLWERLTESAARLKLARLHLDVNMPAIHEGYTATWEWPTSEGQESCWQVDVPLVVSLQPVGRLIVCGHCEGQGAAEHIAQVMELVTPVEMHLRRLTARISTHGPEEFTCERQFCPARTQPGLLRLDCLCGFSPPSNEYTSATSS